MTVRSECVAHGSAGDGWLMVLLLVLDAAFEREVERRGCRAFLRVRWLTWASLQPHWLYNPTRLGTGWESAGSRRDNAMRKLHNNTHTHTHSGSPQLQPPLLLKKKPEISERAKMGLSSSWFTTWVTGDDSRGHAGLHFPQIRRLLNPQSHCRSRTTPTDLPGSGRHSQRLEETNLGRRCWNKKSSKQKLSSVFSRESQKRRVATRFKHGPVSDARTRSSHANT